MKKVYLEPKMNISCFSADDIVTTSGITSSNEVSGDNRQQGAKTTSLSFDDFNFTL